MLTILAILYNLLIAAYHLATPRGVERFRALRPREAPDPAHAPRVTILVPMREEADNAERCVTALLAQRYPATHFEVAVVEEGSTDGTREILERLRAGRPHGAQPRLRLLHTPPLRPGWLGKSQALWWGSQTVADNVAWLLFVDADTFLAPEALATAVREAEARGLDMLSLMPYEEMASWWERVILPFSMLQLLKSVNLRAVNDDARPDAAMAVGQFLLVSHRAYRAVGTHEAIRDELLESVALARRLRRMGFQVRIANGFLLVHTRLFTGLPELWESFQRDGVALYQGSLVAVALSTLVTAFLDLLPFLWPVLALRRGRSRARFWTLAASSLLPPAALLVQRLRSARHFGISRWYALTHPLGAAMTLAMSWSALARLLLRRSFPWKGREYRPASGS